MTVSALTALTLKNWEDRMDTVQIEGYTLEELLSEAGNSLAPLIFTDTPIVFKAQRRFWDNFALQNNG
jgi:hypothetical protein